MKTNNSNTNAQTTSLIKAKDNQLKQGLYVVLVPDVPDAHGDVFTKEAIRKACHSFNQHNPPSNLFHVMNTDSFSTLESFIAPVDMDIDGEVIKEGSWLQKYQFSDALWDEVLADKFSGVSISASGTYIEEEIEVQE